MNTLPGAVGAPRGEGVADRLPRREVVRQGPPLAPRACDVQDRVHDVLEVVGAWPTGRTVAAVTTGDQVVNVLPLQFAQITGIRLPCAHAERVHATPEY